MFLIQQIFTCKRWHARFPAAYSVGWPVCGVVLSDRESVWHRYWDMAPQR